MTTAFEMPSILKGADSLPSPPGVAVELLRLTESEEVTIEELARTIGRDPALAAKLLKVSNSAMYGMGGEVTTLNRACMMLGLKTVRLMSLSFSLATSLGGKRKGAFDYDQYWKRSLVCAASARALASRREGLLADEAFLAGLLSRIGQLVLAQCASSDYAKVLETAKGAWPTPELERSLLGCDGDQVGLALLEDWAMPELTRAVIASIRQEPVSDDEHVARLAPIMQFAAACEELVCSQYKARAFVRLRETAAAVELEGEALDGFLMAVEKEVLETAEIFDVKFGGSLDMGSLLQQAQVRMLDASLSVAALAQQAEHRAVELETSNAQLRTKAQTDQLTGLANRNCFDERLAQCVDRRMAGDSAGYLGLLMIDIDRFKVVNDTHGHLAGDAVLRSVGKAMESVCRESELPARYGGEEFCVLMPATKPVGLAALAKRLRATIEQTDVKFEDKTLKVTASVGGAHLKRVDSSEDGQALIRAADKKLYQAKEKGRNRCAF